ncbi:hypothetical protein AA16663_0868 [Komagataeibacter rhaeticus DSM 16663]|nr:hypothetical protein AA16663_0868 [Komagataeibacter rhaeticus DSM 16663]
MRFAIQQGIIPTDNTRLLAAGYPFPPHNRTARRGQKWQDHATRQAWWARMRVFIYHLSIISPAMRGDYPIFTRSRFAFFPFFKKSAKGGFTPPHRCGYKLLNADPE